jgi:hypothetical protein
MEESLRKTMSSFQRDVNRLKNTCHRLQEHHEAKNKKITKLNLFIDHLLNENKISKEDILNFMKK